MSRVVSSQVLFSFVDRIIETFSCEIRITDPGNQLVYASAGWPANEDAMADIAHVTLQSGKVELGTLSVVGNREGLDDLTAGIKISIESLYEQTAHQNTESAIWHGVTAWVQGLTSPYALDASELQGMAETLGIETDSERAIFVIWAVPSRTLGQMTRVQEERHGAADRDNFARNLVMELGSLFGPRTIIAEVEPNLFLAASVCDGTIWDERRIGRKVARTLREKGILVRIGIGGRRRGIEGYRESYDLARQALRLQDRLGKTEPMLFSDWGGIRLIESVPRAMRTEFLSVYAERFAAMDIELMKTLRAFLDGGLSVKTAASSLHVHRNTLLYRLSQVQTVIGLDPRSFHDALLLRILLWCQDLS